jgi:ribosome-associated protein
VLHITNDIIIDEREIHEEFVRSSGPGGQNVNKVATAVKLRFDVAKSPSLPEDVRNRLKRLAGRRLTREGILIIDARRFRTQEGNRRDAMERFIDLLRRAAMKPKRRIKTRPTLASRRRRLEGKLQRGETKKARQPVRKSDE